MVSVFHERDVPGVLPGKAVDGPPVRDETPETAELAAESLTLLSVPSGASDVLTSPHPWQIDESSHAARLTRAEGGMEVSESLPQ